MQNILYESKIARKDGFFSSIGYADALTQVPGSPA
jgi:hypothetical protein